MIALGSFITSVTQERMFPKIVDNIFDGIPLFLQLRETARPWTGGYRLNIPTEVSTRTSGGSYSGFDTFTTAQENVRQNFTIDPSQYYWNVTVSGIQKAVNKGPQAMVEIIAAEFEGTGKALRNLIAEDLFLDGTGNSSKDINGLVYHIDDATDIVTYQGLSRNTYTNLRATRTAQSGALTFANLASDYDASQIGTDTPTLIVTTPAVFSIIERLVTPTVNVNYNQTFPKLASTGNKQGISLNYGVNSLLYRGVPIISDDQCTSGNIWFVNTNHLFLYEIEQDPLFVKGTKEGFGWSGWIRSQNQDVITSQVIWDGQLVGDSPRTMSRRTGVTS